MKNTLKGVYQLLIATLNVGRHPKMVDSWEYAMILTTFIFLYFDEKKIKTPKDHLHQHVQ